MGVPSCFSDQRRPPCCVHILAPPVGYHTQRADESFHEASGTGTHDTAGAAPSPTGAGILGLENPSYISAAGHNGQDRQGRSEMNRVSREDNETITLGDTITKIP